MIGTVRIFRDEIARVRPCYHGVFSTAENWLIDAIAVGRRLREYRVHSIRASIRETAPGLGTTPTILSHAEAGMLSPEANALRAKLAVKWCRP